MSIPVMHGYVTLKGCHQHRHEQIFRMISGRMELGLDGEKRVCTLHEAYVPEDTEVIDVFAPPREDIFTGQDSHLRRG